MLLGLSLILWVAVLTLNLTLNLSLFGFKLVLQQTQEGKLTIEGFLGLFAAMFIVDMVPGPAVFAISSASMSGGFRRGANITIGLLLADFVFILVVVSGLAYVAEAFEAAFYVLKYCCAAYLVWMGLSLLFSPIKSDPLAHKTTSAGSDILMGFLLTLSNPKAILFYVALFTASVDFAALASMDILGIMACAVLAFGSVNLGYAFIASWANKLTLDREGPCLFNKVAGSILTLTGIGFAVRT